MTDIILGGDWTLDANGDGIYLDCKFDRDYDIEIILQDKLGRAKLKKKMKVGTSTHSLAIDTSQLSDGTYHAWIYVGDKTFVKELKVKRNRAGEKGILGSIFDLFK